MRQYKTLLVFGAVLAAFSAAASALIVNEAADEAPSTDAIQALTQAVAVCPASAPSVAEVLDAHYGSPDALTVKELTRMARRCHGDESDLGPQNQMRQAMAALSAVLHAHTAGPLAEQVAYEEAMAEQLASGEVPSPEFFSAR